MPLTYTEARDKLDQIANDITNLRQKAGKSYTDYLDVQTKLGGLSTKYAQFVTDINAAAAADSWPQADQQKAAKDQMVTEFQAFKSEVDSIVAAIDGA